MWTQLFICSQWCSSGIGVAIPKTYEDSEMDQALKYIADTIYQKNAWIVPRATLPARLTDSYNDVSGPAVSAHTSTSFDQLPLMIRRLVAVSIFSSL